MTSQTTTPLIAQVTSLVVRWHNRHPLARRIGPEHVQGIGIVALPFASRATSAVVPAGIEPQLEIAATPTGGSLRERALAAAAQAAEPTGAGPGLPLPAASPSLASPAHRTPTWRFWERPRRAFSEAFAAPITAARAGGFASTHGAGNDPAPGAWPRREVVVDANLLGHATLAWRYLRTAAIEVGAQRCRVLVAADGSAVIGPRLWSLPRCAVAALVPMSVGLVLMAPGLQLGTPVKPDVLAAATVPAPLPPVSPAALPPSPTPPTPSSPAATVVPLVRPVDPAASAAAAASSPTVAAPATAVANATSSTPTIAAEKPPETRSDAFRVDIRPRLDAEAARVARRESGAMRQPGASAPTQPILAKAKPLATATTTPVVAAKGAQVFALVARQTRTRAASEVLLGLMRSSASATPAGAMRTEVLPSTQGFRASWWPFVSRDDAERARSRLASVGLPVDVVEF